MFKNTFMLKIYPKASKKTRIYFNLFGWPWGFCPNLRPLCTALLWLMLQWYTVPSTRMHTKYFIPNYFRSNFSEVILQNFISESYSWIVRLKLCFQILKHNTVLPSLGRSPRLVYLPEHYDHLLQDWCNIGPSYRTSSFNASPRLVQPMRISFAW